jgi:sulfonate transport system permease protein
MSRSRGALRGLILPAITLLVWEGLSRAGLEDPHVFPPLEWIVQTAWTDTIHASLALNMLSSLERCAGGFVIGGLAGLLAGAAFGLSQMVRVLFQPLFNALKQIAVFAWIPLIAMWFGIGESSKLAFIALATFTPVLVNTEEGFRRAPAGLLDVGAVLTLGRLQVIRRIIIPAALPSVMTGLQLGLIHAWLGTIGAEFFMTAGPGIGTFVAEGRDRFQMSQTLVGVVLLGLIGFSLQRGAQAIERRALNWRQA